MAKRVTEFWWEQAGAPRKWIGNSWTCVIIRCDIISLFQSFHNVENVQELTNEKGQTKEMRSHSEGTRYQSPATVEASLKLSLERVRF